MCIYLKKMKTVLWKDSCSPVFVVALFTIAKIQKQPKIPSIGEWTKKMWYMCVYIWNVPVITKNEILPYATIWMDLEGIIGECNGTPLQYSCLEKPTDGGAWWAAVHGVSKSWRWLSGFTFTFHFHALEKEMEPTPVFLPGESQGRGSLVGCRLWGHTESDTTEVT